MFSKNESKPKLRGRKRKADQFNFSENPSSKHVKYQGTFNGFADALRGQYEGLRQSSGYEADVSSSGGSPHLQLPNGQLGNSPLYTASPLSVNSFGASPSFGTSFIGASPSSGGARLFGPSGSFDAPTSLASPLFATSTAGL